jgi:hypothetical protein
MWMQKTMLDQGFISSVLASSGSEADHSGFQVYLVADAVA